MEREEVDSTVEAVCGESPRSVGITTALKGAGGFGKTTVARLVCADARVFERFGKHVYFVTVGREVRSRAAIAGKVAEVTRAITGDSVEVGEDPEQLGDHLGALLAKRPRSLLVIDDVWEEVQLKPFLRGAEGHCVRLVTTRNPDVLPASARHITVDRMSEDQARAVLTHDVHPPLLAEEVTALLRATGRWALLLRLVNQYILALMGTGLAPPTSARQVLERLRASGPAGADQQTPLDLDDPEARNKAVRASIEAATGLLAPSDGERFAELGIFAEDEEIPLRLVAMLWRSAGYDEPSSRMLCKQMANLSLLSINCGISGGAVTLHDVVRDYLRSELSDRLPETNAVLLDALAAELPHHTNTGHTISENTQWWHVQDGYVQDHLIEHLTDAGRHEEAFAVAGDLRWVRARLHQRGPTAPMSDLEQLRSPAAIKLAADLARAAHLLSPTEPCHSLDAVLRSRLHALPHWSTQINNLQVSSPALLDKWPPPDMPHPALHRTLIGHTGSVHAVAFSPDGKDLATAEGGATVRIWDVATGAERRALTGLHAGLLQSVAFSPDGAWLATADFGGDVQIWDLATGEERRILTGHVSFLQSVAVSPNGIWLATADFDGDVRIWDVATGEERRPLAGHNGRVHSVAFSPDGAWLATVGRDGTLRIQDATTGEERHTLNGNTISVRSVAVSPNATLLATAGDGMVRIWDIATGEEHRAFVGHTHLTGSTGVSPDSAWLATTNRDGTVRILDAITGEERRALTGNASFTWSTGVSPDGAWLATVDLDGTVQIQDIATGEERHTLNGSDSLMRSVVFSPDGAWLATVGHDGTLRIQDATTGEERHTFNGNTFSVRSVAFSPDGAWLATVGHNGTLRIQDATTGEERHTLNGNTISVRSVAFSPDGAWLATVGHDGTLRIWDLATGLSPAMTRIDGKAHDCIWSPDQQSLYVAGRAGLYGYTFESGTTGN